MFSRLFTYARSTGMSQIENFTTEALAAAIRVDHEPFMRVMSQFGVVSNPASADVHVTTQEAIPGVGVIDLIGRVIVRTVVVAEVWIEAEVWAPESGDQLSRYLRHLATRTDGVTRVLVTVGPKPVGSLDGVPWISWQAFRDDINRSRDPNPIWREFSAFLEEQNVADTSTDPLTAREAASLLDAYSFFKKATRVLTDVNEIGRERWPTWGWGGKDQITQLILGQFQRQAPFTIFTTMRPVYLVIGYTDLRAVGEAQLTVWVESDPKKAEVRMTVLRAAEAGGLDSAWIRRTDSWQALGRTHRAATIEGAQGAVSWFIERLEELDRAGMVPVHP